MKVLLITNFVSHHQLPLARALAERLGPQGFRMAVTEPVSEERCAMGWGSNASEPWLLRLAEDPAARAEYDAWWREADLVLTGHRDLDDIRARLERGQVVAYACERWWKPPFGRARLLHLRFLSMALAFRAFSGSPHFHYLAKGDHAADDFHWLTRRPERIWRWGYFPPTPPPPTLPAGLRPPSILWAGRMLRWKRVDILLRAFAKVEHPEARLTLVGKGPERPGLEALAASLGVGSRVSWQDPVPAPEVPSMMAAHRAYVLPSNGYEGWGAVVNEALGAGCATLVSQEAGASVMIRHGENGLRFRAGEIADIADLLSKVLERPEEATRMGSAGRNTLCTLWNAEIAADRLLEAFEAWRQGHGSALHSEGPLSHPL